ncbi:tetratricopeptide repeat protein [Terracidiphilus gabretensis]|uniref:tetratricopeptide repeat protein n=1 Tax=Terracidiphilus gabretensis TaxID=1577687 RepID=UPI00071B7209|nr:tetratricopeptide repeat protein [Terracidiphilus gabretensis]
MIPFLFVAPALAQNAANVNASREAALNLEQQGKLADAEAAWHVILKAQPGNAEALAHLGLVASRQEHYKDAAAYYRKALAINPKLPGVQLNLGLALFKDGEMKEAVPVFAQLLKSAAPDSPDAQRYTILLAMSHYGAQEYAQAVPLLKLAATHDPQNLTLLMTLAHSCLWSKQYPCVLDTYHEILALNAESAEADMLAGEASDELHDHADAIEQFRAAVKANPNEPEVHFGLGYLLWTQKHLDEAATEFQAELTNDPKHTQSMLYLGDAYLQLNQPEKARPFLEQAEQADPSQWRVHLDLGILATDAGQNDEALRQLLLADKQQPSEVSVHMRLGRLYKAMGKTAEAKTEFSKASTLTQASDEVLVRQMRPKNPALPPQ